MNTTKIVAGVAMAFTALALTGCGTGPSESEIVEIVKKDNEQTRERIQKMGMGAPGLAKNLVPTVHSVKKIGCEKDGGGVKCDVEVDLEQMGERAKSAVKLRFVKGSDGWVVSN